MKLLVIGDVVSAPGMQTVKNLLPQLKKEYGADFVIANGENCSGVGIQVPQAEDLFAYGVDVITLGNHTFKQKSIATFLDENRYILRPANYAPQLPGVGYGIYDVCGYRLLVMNLIGRCDMAFGAENPFLMADKILKEAAGRFDMAVCEIHGQATSEKVAMGFYLDGRVSGVYGTHTHVQTNDARINPKNSGYITDIGMTGPLYSVLGVEPQQSIAMFRGDLTDRFQAASGVCTLNGALFTIDGLTCKSIVPVQAQWGL